MKATTYYYKVYFTNLWYYLPDKFKSLDEAKESGKNKGYEFRVDMFREEFVEIVGFSTAFSGWHDMPKNDEETAQ